MPLIRKLEKSPSEIHHPDCVQRPSDDAESLDFDTVQSRVNFEKLKQLKAEDRKMRK